MTYEKGLFAQADPGIVSGSTNERKKMSTKTIYKRIALVAVATLGAGVLSVAPASAAVGQLTVTGALVKGAASTSATTATGVVGNQVIFTYEENITGGATAYVISDANGRLVSASVDAALTGAITGTNGVNLTDGAKWTIVTGEADTATIGLTASAPGTQVVRVQQLTAGTGLYTTLATLTVTWVAAASETGVDAAQSTLYVVASGVTCDFGTNKSADVNASAAIAISSVPANTAVDVCFMGRNKAGQALTAAAATAVISSAGATFAAEGAEDGGYEAASAGAAPAAYTGTSTITVIFIDQLGSAATLTTSLTYYGDIASIAIANAPVAGGYAAKQGGTNDAGTSASTLSALTSAALPGTSTSSIGWLFVTAKDAGGNIINLSAAGNNDMSGFTVDSDFTAGAPAAGTSDSAGATIALSDGAGDISPAAFGANVALVRCHTSSVAEKLTISVRGVNAAGTRITSPTAATFHCSGAVAKVTVTATASTANVDVTDAKGYPVADGTSVSLVASNGAVVAPATKPTVNGKFATAALVIPSTTSGSASVTAIVGAVTGSAAITGTGTSEIASLTTLVNSLVAKINALNKLVVKIQKKVRA
jgi:trimeric autotransporter adhesin